MRTAVACLLALAIGCSPEFDRASEIRTVRVLGVHKDKPYPAPGETVTLTMLDHDGSDPSAELSRLWIAGCENPPGDLYAGCFPQLAERLASDEPPPIGSGRQFTFQVDEKIIESRPPPTDQFPAYGTIYVFFAVCRGTIEVAPPEDFAKFPLACYSRDRKRLGADDFVVGYTSLYVYDGLRNENPIITGFEIDGKRVEPDCIGVDCVVEGSGAGGGGAGDAGFIPIDGGLDDLDAGVDAARGDAGAMGPAAPARDENCSPSDPACVQLCDEEDDDKCPDIPIRPIVDPESAEVDEVLEAAGQGRLLEQMWVNYYVDRGSLASDVKLLNDAVKGWNDDYATDYRAPRRPGSARVWAVAHDNRGGMQWVRVTLGVRE